MMKPKTCPYCGKEFIPNAGSQRYCSRQCSRLWYESTHPMLHGKEKGLFRKTIQPSVSIAEIQRRARELGLSYGHYMLQYGETDKHSDER